MDGKSLNEARALRYLVDALDDLASAEALIEKGIYNQVLFHCQQATEKGSKACLCLFGIVLAEEHKYADFLQKMIVPSSGKLQEKFKKLMVKVSILENFYIRARYGIDLQGRIHLEEFEKQEVNDSYNAVENFVELCFLFLEQKINSRLPRQKKQLVLYLQENYKEFIK